MPTMLRMSKKLQKMAQRVLNVPTVKHSPRWKKVNKRLKFEETDRIR